MPMTVNQTIKRKRQRRVRFQRFKAAATAAAATATVAEMPTAMRVIMSCYLCVRVTKEGKRRSLLDDLEQLFQIFRNSHLLGLTPVLAIVPQLRQLAA